LPQPALVVAVLQAHTNKLLKNMQKKFYLNSEAAGIDQIYTHHACPRGNGRTF